MVIYVLVHRIDPRGTSTDIEIYTKATAIGRYFLEAVVSCSLLSTVRTVVGHTHIWKMNTVLAFKRQIA